jgi:hypothetical protein
MEKYYQKGIYPAPYKLIVLGDVHGDFYATVNSLKKGKVIDNQLNWCCGKAHVVQMGDILDRKCRDTNMNDEDSEFHIITLFIKLMKQSLEKGGGFHCILGNHELMNVNGNFNYTSRKGITHFRNRLRGRRVFFMPGSNMCKIFSKYWNPIIKIGKFIFCHGGLSYKISSKYSIPQINGLMRLYLKGKIRLERNIHFNILFNNNNSILWNRNYSTGQFDIHKTKKLLELKKCKYMVVGHTPQKEGINLKKGLIWCTDTGMSEAFGKRVNDNKLQLLLIIKNGKNMKVLR